MKKRIPMIALILAVSVLFSFFASSCGEKNEEKKKGFEPDVKIVYAPSNGYDASESQLDAAKSIIETRLDYLGYTEHKISVDSKENTITVSFKWPDGETKRSASNAAEEIGSTAQLTFRPGNEHESEITGSDGNIICRIPAGETKEVLMDGSCVKSAEAIADSYNDGQYVVLIEFTDEGAKKFAEITEQRVGEVISIWMDEVMLSAPTVYQKITEGKIQLAGGFTAEEAQALAKKINAGMLPFELEVKEFKDVK